MIKTLLLGSAGLIALSSAALAADLPSRRAPPVYIPPPIPVFSWAGFYIGGQIGYAFGRDSAVLDVSPILPGGVRGQTLFPYGSNRVNGLIGGGHVGYNFAFPGVGFGNALILGVEGDVDGSDYRSTSDVGAALGGPAGILFNRVRNDIDGSIRGRLGVAFDRALFYATGGAAFGEFKSGYFSPLANALLPQNFSHTRVGYTVGGGVEYAITTQWSLRAEYRYTDFGTFTDVLNNGNNTSFPVRHRETQNKVQVGFSYKFDSPLAAPVVARY